MWEREGKAVAEAIARDFPADKDAGRVMWISGQTPAARVIDCVLSLNRNYKKVVVPRVEGFISQYPLARSCKDLAELVHSFTSPEHFSKDVLQYNSALLGQRLLAVTEYLIDSQEKFAMPTEEERLRCWANNTEPDDYRTLKIPGFGPAGFQYLRVLFGADTSKPDIYIIRYISKAVGRTVSALHALSILHKAGAMAGRSIRRLDYLIWNDGTASKSSETEACCVRTVVNRISCRSK